MKTQFRERGPAGAFCRMVKKAREGAKGQRDKNERAQRPEGMIKRENWIREHKDKRQSQRKGCLDADQVHTANGPDKKTQTRKIILGTSEAEKRLNPAQ